MTLTRRELATAAMAAVAAPSAESQTPQPAADLAKVVHDANQRNSEALAKFEIPMATEPAFQFKA
jgi:hypothetical protein